MTKSDITDNQDHSQNSSSIGSLWVRSLYRFFLGNGLDSLPVINYTNAIFTSFPHTHTTIPQETKCSSAWVNNNAGNSIDGTAGNAGCGNAVGGKIGCGNCGFIFTETA
ncbi:hypothetical protein DPMN_132990 [Dreissena polymorpha]|uniref:Uncharacterized protein n=1 Tax=Dreissena polymorpha TaxID=45954 RepID=A0A9D4FUE0_DREPO|nr:hypothetical protein DPMN_132990 [Dreissena polymorpha]